FQNHAGGFQHWNKIYRWNCTFGWMHPAQQCFSSNDAAAVYINFRLVVQFKLFFIKRTMKISFHYQLPTDFIRHFFIEKFNGVATLFFYLIHRGISVTQQLVHGIIFVGVYNYAHATRYAQFHIVVQGWLRYYAANFFANFASA